MTAVRKNDIARMREQRQRREAIRAALRPLALRRYKQMLLWGSCDISPADDAAAVAGLPKPAPLPWGQQ